jgi:hypothetical protein
MTDKGLGNWEKGRQEIKRQCEILNVDPETENTRMLMGKFKCLQFKIL